MAPHETLEKSPQELMLDRARRDQHHTVAEIELALRVVAYQGGNVNAALKILNPHRTKPLNAQTVRRWVNEHYHDRYQELVLHELEGIQQHAGIRALELAAEAQTVTADLVDRTKKAAKKGQIEPKDLAPAARNMAQVMATGVEKGLQLTGQPTHKVSVDSLPELVNELRTMLGGQVDAEDAEEVP